MGERLIRPLVPPGPQDRRIAPLLADGRAATRPPSLPDLGTLPVAVTVPYAIASIDRCGTVTDAATISALGWSPGQRVAITVQSGAAIVRWDDEGLYRLTTRGQVRLPAPARHLLHLSAGDRLLLAACPDQRFLALHTMSTLNDIITQHHAALGLPPNGGG